MKTIAYRKKTSARVRRAIRRRAFWLLLLSVLVAIFLWRREGTGQIPAYRLAIDYPAMPPLANTMVQAHYRGAPLSKVLDDLSRQAGIPFKVDWESLRASEINPDTKVDCNSRTNEPIPLIAALVLLKLPNDLRMVADFTTNPLLVGPNVTINPVDRTDATVVVVYPIADLLRIRDPWCYAGASGERAMMLWRLIMTVVEADAWKDAGGTVGEVKPDHDNLIITATPTMQYQIKELLDELRRQK